LKPDYYVQAVGQVIRFKALLVIGFVLVLLSLALTGQGAERQSDLLARHSASFRAYEDTKRRYQDVFPGRG